MSWKEKRCQTSGGKRTGGAPCGALGHGAGARGRGRAGANGGLWGRGQPTHALQAGAKVTVNASGTRRNPVQVSPPMPAPTHRRDTLPAHVEGGYRHRPDRPRGHRRPAVQKWLLNGQEFSPPSRRSSFDGGRQRHPDGPVHAARPASTGLRRTTRARSIPPITCPTVCCAGPTSRSAFIWKTTDVRRRRANGKSFSGFDLWVRATGRRRGVPGSPAAAHPPRSRSPWRTGGTPGTPAQTTAGISNPTGVSPRRLS